MRTADLTFLPGVALILAFAAPAAGATADASYSHWASEPGTLVLALGGLAMMRMARMRRKRTVIFPLFERDSA